MSPMRALFSNFSCWRTFNIENMLSNAMNDYSIYFSNVTNLYGVSFKNGEIVLCAIFFSLLFIIFSMCFVRPHIWKIFHMWNTKPNVTKMSTNIPEWFSELVEYIHRTIYIYSELWHCILWIRKNIPFHFISLIQTTWCAARVEWGEGEWWSETTMCNSNVHFSVTIYRDNIVIFNSASIFWTVEQIYDLFSILMMMQSIIQSSYQRYFQSNEFARCWRSLPDLYSK